MEVALTGLQFYAYHGVLPHERTQGGNYTVDVHLGLADQAVAQAAAADDLTHTVDYGAVAQTIQAEMDTPRNLIETVAHAIATKIYQQWRDRLTYVRVRLQKHDPPIHLPNSVAQAVVTVGNS